MLILYALAQGFTGKSDLFSRQESLTRALPGFSFAYDDGVPGKVSSWGHRAIFGAAALNDQRNCRAGDSHQVVRRTMGRHQYPTEHRHDVQSNVPVFRRQPAV